MTVTLKTRQTTSNYDVRDDYPFKYAVVCTRILIILTILMYKRDSIINLTVLITLIGEMYGVAERIL